MRLTIADLRCGVVILRLVPANHSVGTAVRSVAAALGGSSIPYLLPQTSWPEWGSGSR
jgi:hypothetical protein